MDRKEINNLLVEGAAQLGIVLTEEKIKVFDQFLEELNEWRKRINLISRADDRDIILKDFLDSLTILKYVPRGASVADLGSGAGFPGIPLKIARPDIKALLLESTRKKVFFLKNLVRILGLRDVEVHWAEKREEPRGEDSGEFDMVISRAFGSLLKFSSIGGPLVRRGGILLAMKGKKGKEELGESLPLLNKMGLEQAFVEQIRLPFLHHERFLIGLQKE